MATLLDQLQGSLSIDEALAYLRLTPRTVYRMIRSGELPAMRVGRQWRFRQRDLDVWLERRQRTSRESASARA